MRRALSDEELALTEQLQWPPRGFEAEVDSFNVHASLTRCVCQHHRPRMTSLDLAMNWTSYRLRKATSLQPDDLLSKEHFTRVLEDIDLASSPGVPLLFTYPTNRDFLWDGDSWNTQNVELLWDRVRRRLASRDSDPIRVFIKCEPHKLKKIQEKRYRLISSVSLVDSVVDHMLFGWQNDSLVRNFVHLPVAVGWSPLYGGYKWIEPALVGYDRRAWDWTVPRWLLEAEMQVRFDLNANPSKLWTELVRWRYNRLYDANLFQLSNGWQIEQMVPGVLKSGSVNTISSNSIMQCILHAYCLHECSMPLDGEFVAMGDDTLQEHTSPEYVDLLSSIIDLKPPTTGEFCGIDFTEGVEPINTPKHFKNLLYAKDADLHNSLISLQLNYGGSRRFGRMREIVTSVDSTALLPRREVSAIFHG